MKLVSYGPPRAERPGVLADDDTILPLSPLLEDLGVPFADMNGVLGLLDFLRPRIDDALAAGNDRVDVASVRLGPPVPRPPKIVVVGGNYRDHVEEASAVTKGVPPRMPLLVLKPHTNIIGPFDPLLRPRGTSKLDYEGEMAVVIGRVGKHVTRERAWDHVAGFMCSQDMGDREVMMGDVDLSPLYMQPTRGKAFDTFCPTGPWIVTRDEAPDPADMRVQLWVNDELRQDATANEMIVDVPGIVEWLSGTMTLAPGDVLLTGTPAGCGGMMDPPVFLQPGDVVKTAISGLGAMENSVEDER